MEEGPHHTLIFKAVSFYCHFTVKMQCCGLKDKEKERPLKWKGTLLQSLMLLNSSLCNYVATWILYLLRWKVQSYNIIRIPGVWRCPHASALSFWWTLHCFCQASYPWDLAVFWFQSSDSCSDNSPRHPLHPQLSWCCLLWLLEDLWNIQFWFPCLKKEKKVYFFPIFFYHTLCLKVNKLENFLLMRKSLREVITNKTCLVPFSAF